MSPACGHCGQLHEAYVTMCPVTGARLGSATYTMTNEDEVLVGNVIGDRYDIRDIFGQGSTGTVFGVVHMQFVRTFAMKVLRPRYTTIDSVHRVFHGEARAAFSVAHPSLCEIFDVGTLPDGAPFFVMEKLEGDTLASRLGKERFSTAAAVDLMMQLLSAMDAVHSRELIFRDLRPQNVFLAHRRGCRPLVKVLDFGLSRLVPLERVQAQWDALRAVAAPNDMTGALSIPYYLSPERTRGEHGVDAASDIFTAGTVFYEALTAQKPFNGSTWNALVGQIQQAQPTPLAVLRPDVPPELSALVTRALSAKPRSRPPSAREMQDELRSVFEGQRRGSSSMRAVQAAVPVSTVDSTAHTPVRADRHTGNLPAFSLPASALMPPPRSVTDASQVSRGPQSKTSPPSGAHPTDRPLRAARPQDLYDDETSTDTDRKSIDAIIAGSPSRGARVAPDAPDEASADHPIRTVRPPSAIDMEIEVLIEQDAPATSRGGDLATALGLATKMSDEDEETETMELTPEVRARIAQMTRSGGPTPAAQPHQPPPASSVEDSNRPPPTRRLTKPTRRQ